MSQPQKERNKRITWEHGKEMKLLFWVSIHYIFKHTVCGMYSRKLLWSPGTWKACLQVRIGRREPKAKELQRETKQATWSEKKIKKKKQEGPEEVCFSPHIHLQHSWITFLCLLSKDRQARDCGWEKSNVVPQSPSATIPNHSFSGQ